MKDNKLSQMKSDYKKAKSAKVGDICKCPSCGTEFVKTNYQQAFCKTKKGTKCKDYYWNNVIPEKRCNTTRISPANAAWKEKNALERGYPDYDTMIKDQFDDALGEEGDSFSVTIERCPCCGLRYEYCQCDNDL